MSNKFLTIIKTIMKTHLVDNLKINIFIKNNVLISQKIKFDLINNEITIGSCQNLTIKIEIVVKNNFKVRQTIHIKRIITILILFIISIFVIYRGTFPDDKDFLFKPQFKQNLNYDRDIYAHIINSLLSFMQLRNILNKPTQIIKRTRLNSIIKFNKEEIFLTTPKITSFTANK